MTALFEHPFLAVVALILGFGFLIFVHELGHFAVAKWVGIRATQFAIGFGHALVSYRKGLGLRVGGTEREYRQRALEKIAESKSVAVEELTMREDTPTSVTEEDIYAAADELGLGETEYRLNWMPLGGYVKMLGQEDMDPKAQSQDPRAFNKKSIGARAAVISAGVIMNMIFGLIFFIICFQMGVKFNGPVVGDVRQLSPAATTFAVGHEGEPAYMGLRPGDVIVEADGNPVRDMTEVKIATALGKKGRAVELVVERDGEPSPLTFAVVPTPDRQQEMLLSAGIIPGYTLDVAAVFEDTPFHEAGVKADMTITAVDGRPIETYGQYAAAFDAAGGDPVTVTLTGDDGRTIDVAVEPRPAFRTSAQSIELAGITPATQITVVTEDSPADDAGVKENDLIARIDTTDWPNSQEVLQLIGDAGSDGIALVVQRNGVQIDLGQVKPNSGLFAKNKGMIGIGLGPAFDTMTIGRVTPESPLAAANLPGGSVLTQVNGQTVTSWADFQQALGRIQTTDDQPTVVGLAVRVNLGEQPVEQIEVPFTAAQLQAVRLAGWRPPGEIGLANLMTELKADGPVEATMIGAVKTKQFVQQTYITLLRLFQGSIGVKNLRGPVGIVDEGSKIARQGVSYYLFFLGLISVNLAVLNFLPIPIVDGGLMVFLIIEKIKGSPASPQVQTAVALVGLVGLACVFLYVTFNDISRLVTG